VLTLKIVLTAAVWCVPMLLFPPDVLRALGFPVPEPLLFVRLLGMAYVALLVGYGLGLRDARAGRYPATVVWMGLVSNGGACLLLLVAACVGTWAPWGAFARAVMWGSLFGTAAITAGLAWFGPRLDGKGSGS